MSVSQSVGDGEQVEEELPEESTADEREAASEPELSLDVMFEILKNERRRFVLKYFEDREGPVALGDLAEHVAAKENDKPERELTSGERKRVYVGLYQCHLPKMNDAGIVDFNRNRGRIELGENADLLTEYLDTEESTERPWPQYYLGIAAVGGALFGLGQFGLYPVPWLTTVVAAVVIVGFAACALVHDRATAE